MTGQETAFDEWCLVELMGHQRIAGRVTEQSIGGQSLLRVDVPANAETGRQALTKFYGPGAVYCLTPVSESIARRLADNIATPAVHRWDLRAPELPGPSDDDDDEAWPADEEDAPDGRDHESRSDAPPL